MPDSGATSVIDRYLPFPLPIPVPVKLGGILTAAASFVDLNYGAIAGGLTVVGGAATLVYWNFANKRTEALKADNAAKLLAFKESEAAKLEIYRASEAAKLQVQREAELAKILIQKEHDEANKGSLSAQMAMMSGQLSAIQRSADEANRSLLDAREMNKLLREQLDGAAGRIEDANKKLHDIVNEVNVKNLEHELEKKELQAAKDKVVKQLEDIQRSTDHVTEQLTPKIADNSARLDETSARLDKLDGGV